MERINDGNNFVAVKLCFLQNEWVKKKILTANFTILANCPLQNYFGCQHNPKSQKKFNTPDKIMKKFTTLNFIPETNNKMIIYDKMLGSGRTRKYLALGQYAGMETVISRLFVSLARNEGKRRETWSAIGEGGKFPSLLLWTHYALLVFPRQ